MHEPGRTCAVGERMRLDRIAQERMFCIRLNRDLKTSVSGGIELDERAEPKS